MSGQDDDWKFMSPEEKMRERMFEEKLARARGKFYADREQENVYQNQMRAEREKVASHYDEQIESMSKEIDELREELRSYRKTARK